MNCLHISPLDQIKLASKLKKCQSCEDIQLELKPPAKTRGIVPQFNLIKILFEAVLRRFNPNMRIKKSSSSNIGPTEMDEI